MPESHEQLEQELHSIWQRATNTRKVTSRQRVEHILRRSRAELSIRDLLKFTSYLIAAFFQLFGAVLHALSSTRHNHSFAPEKNDHE